MGALDRFSVLTRAWFASTFPAPTVAQERGWEAISRGQHTLVLAPTGSGKTLAAFLWAIDRLVTEPAFALGTRAPALRVLYVSPLKALTCDVERNLRAPLAGIALEAERRGTPVPRLRVAIRAGDTSEAERRQIVRHPPDILVTTPESLYLSSLHPPGRCWNRSTRSSSRRSTRWREPSEGHTWRSRSSGWSAWCEARALASHLSRASSSA